MDLRDYLRTLRRGWALILGFIVLGVAAGTALTVTTSKVYQATVQVFVATAGLADSQALAQGNNFIQDRVQSYVYIAASPQVTGAVISELHLKLTQQQLANKITAKAPVDRVVVNLSVTDHNPQLATNIANVLARKFDDVVAKTEQTNSNGDPVVKLSVIRPATVPGSPIKPDAVLDVGLGLLLGLVVGAGFVIVRNNLDNTVKGAEDFAEADVPVIGSVPFDKRTDDSPIAFRGDPHSARAEAYRLLRSNLQFMNVDESPRIIAVTSAVSGEGKSTTAMNLAAALAEAGSRVCLVEADLRRPTLAKSLGLVPDIGFTTILTSRAPLEDVLQSAGPNLAVLTSGALPPNPSEVLISVQAAELIGKIAEQFDYTIIDTAPLLPVADGSEVAALADATLVVYRAGKTTREQAARSLLALKKIGEHPIGVILNMVTRRTGRYDDYDKGYYYGYQPRRAHAAESAHPATSAEPSSVERTARAESIDPVPGDTRR
jgi:capsular exopolysaccharide synthesis family protein